MKLIFMGTPDFAAATLRALLESRHEVVLVLTQPDKPKGRSGQLQPSPVKELAQAHGIPVFQPVRLRAPETFEELRKYDADAAVVAAYGKIIPKNILELPKYGCINVHASLLPAYRGAAPIQWAVLNGEKTSGVTIMQMDEGLDTGDMICRKEVALDPKETADSLFDKLSALGASLLVETLDAVEAGKAEPVKQPAESPTPYARMITKEDGKIDWNRPAEEIERLVRGMNSWPGAYTMMEGKTVKLWDTEVLAEESGEAPGTLLRPERNILRVQTGRGQLRIRELQLQGKKRMKCDAFLCGCRWEAGMRFDA